MVVHMTRKAQWVARVKMNKAVTAWTQQRAWRRLGGEGWGMMVRHWVFAGEELA